MHGSGVGTDGTLGADASWGDVMEQNGDDKFNNEPQIVNNQRSNLNRNQRLVSTLMSLFRQN